MPLNAANLPLREIRDTPAPPSSYPAPLWLCIHLPKLALEALAPQAQDTPPLAVLDEHKGRPVIHTASSAAECVGVSQGMPLGAAHALCPTLQWRPRDPQAETQTLRRLAVWTARFTPVELTVDRDWRPLSFSAVGAVAKAPVVFAGYGIVAPAGAGHPAYRKTPEFTRKSKQVRELVEKSAIGE